MYSSVPLKSPVIGCLPCVVCGNSIVRQQIVTNSSNSGNGFGVGKNIPVEIIEAAKYPPIPIVPQNPPYPAETFCVFPTKSPDFTWIQDLSGKSTWCNSVKTGEQSFVNPLGVAAYVYLCGGVDDDILINNVVAQPGEFVFRCGLNGAHNFNLVYEIGPNETIYVGVNNNFASISSINVKLYYLPK